jgi:putative integral membrane protein (TIGR02587 family)
MQSRIQHRNREFALGVARAFAGAVLFGLPLLMTMEMWSLGFSMDPLRLALFQVLFFPVLVVLSWHSGFEPTFSWRDDVVDALVAYAVGMVASAIVLAITGMLDADMSVREVVGKIALQAVPASMGALLSQTQLGERDAGDAPEHGGEGYWSDLFVMGAGALFLGFNLAPTEEMVLISVRITEVQAILLLLASVAIIHGFVYRVSFRGEPRRAGRGRRMEQFFRYSVVGYVLACALSAYLLWSFGRLDGVSLLAGAKAVIVLGFPAALGAAAARLIL